MIHRPEGAVWRAATLQNKARHTMKNKTQTDIAKKHLYEHVCITKHFGIKVSYFDGQRIEPRTPPAPHHPISLEPPFENEIHRSPMSQPYQTFSDI